VRTRTTTVRLPTELVDRIRNLAERHERSLGGQLRWALGEYYLDNELEYGMIRFARRIRRSAGKGPGAPVRGAEPTGRKYGQERGRVSRVASRSVR